MLFKKITTITIVIMLILSITGCSVIDMMDGLNTKEEEENDFAIIEDGIVDIGDEAAEEGYSIDETAELRESVIYLEDNNGFIVPLKTKIPWEEGIAKAVLKHLIKGNPLAMQVEEIGLNGVIPENTQILGMSINEGLCKVDLSRDIFNTTSFEEEKNMISAITYTLTEFSTIDSVKIMVEGEYVPTLSKGYLIDTAFERGNINLFGRENGANFTVYYKSNDVNSAGLFIPITFTADSVDNPVNIVLQRLFNGPPADLPMTNQIPFGVDYQGMKIEEGKVFVDLSMGAINLSQEEYNDINQMVVLCLEQFNDIADVEYLIEGMTFEEAGMELEDNEVVPTFNEY